MGILTRSHPAQRRGVRIPARLILALVIAGVSIFGYYSVSQKNPVTGATQHIKLSHEQEVALGLNAAPELIGQLGGLSRSAQAVALVERVGAKIAAHFPPEFPRYPLKFHLLGDPNTVNAFALPGGQIFITEALVSRLTTEGQLAGVLGHEVGHVLARHSAQQMAKAELTQGLVGAAAVATSDGGYSGAQLAQYVGHFVLLKYGRTDELEADRLGLRFMAAAGYDPRSLIEVMRILEEASREAGAGRTPDFLATHPNPGNRREQIEREIAALFPGGVPEGLIK